MVQWTAVVQGTHSGEPYSPLPGVPPISAKKPPVACKNDAERMTNPPTPMAIPHIQQAILTVQYYWRRESVTRCQHSIKWASTLAQAVFRIFFGV